MCVIFDFVNNLIVISQKYTKIDTVYFLRGGFWLSLNQLASLGTSIILGLAFANFISKDTYGTYIFTISIFTLLSLTTLPGFETALIRAISRGQDKALVLTVKTRFLWGLLGSAVAFGLAFFYLLANNLTLGLSMLLIGIFLPLIGSTESYDPFLQGKKQFNLSARYNIISGILLAITLVGALVLSKNVVVILGIYLLVSFFTNAFFLWKTKALATQKTAVDKGYQSYGKNLTLMSVLAVVVNYIDIPIMFHFLGAAEAAIYTVALAPPDQVKGLFKMTATLSLPKLAGQKYHEVKKNMARYIFFLLLSSIALAICYVVLAPFGYRFLFPNYTNAIYYSQLIAISFVSFPIYLIVSALQATKQTKKLYLVNVFPPIVQLVLVVVLIPTFGIGGAIASRVIGRIFSFVYTLYLYYGK